MGVRDQLVEVKLGQAKEICRSFKSDLDHYENRGRVTSAGEYVVAALHTGIDGLLKKLNSIEQSDQLKIWSNNVIESKIHRLTQYIHEFVEILSLLESSRVRDVPYEVASPLKKEVRNVFPDSELLVVSASKLNYSILELSSILRKRLTELDCKIPNNLPDKIFRVAIPSTTYKKSLLLSIFSHELGHPMYERYDIEDDIMPIEVDKGLINKYIEKVRDSNIGTGYNKSKARIRGEITDQINETIHNWVEEVSADLFALNIFGPSYLYAFIYLVPTISRLDSAGKSHPPPRIRLKLLTEEVESLYDIYTIPSNETRSFVKDWKDISNENINFNKFVSLVAYKSMEDDDTFSQIKESVNESIPEELSYSKDSYSFDLDNLVPLIYNQIPPIEIRHDGETRNSRTVNVLNSSWDAYIRGLDKFGQVAKGADDESDFAISSKFNEFVLKSLELTDIKRSWHQATERLPQ